MIKEAELQTDKITSLPLSKLVDFENHPFKVVQDDELTKLVESIKKNGVLIPAIARPKGDEFELIAGHRRKLAAAIAGLGTMPVLVREMTDEQAVISMVDSNVQRENVLPSEKAFAYKMKLDAIKRQGKRSDLTSGRVGNVDKIKTASGKRTRMPTAVQSEKNNGRNQPAHFTSLLIFIAVADKRQ